MIGQSYLDKTVFTLRASPTTSILGVDVHHWLLWDTPDRNCLLTPKPLDFGPQDMEIEAPTPTLEEPIPFQEASLFGYLTDFPLLYKYSITVLHFHNDSIKWYWANLGQLNKLLYGVDSFKESIPETPILVKSGVLSLLLSLSDRRCRCEDLLPYRPRRI